MVAALGAATGAFGAGCSDDAGREGEPATSSSSTSAPTTTTTVLAEAFPGIWPFTTAADAGNYAPKPDDPYLDPVRTAAEFMRAYGGMSEPVAGEYRAGDPQSGEVEVRPGADSPFVTTVLVRRAGAESGVWVVVGAVAERIQVRTPVALDGIASPVAVSGESSAFEGNVVVQVKEDGMGPGEFLGQEPVTGGAGPDLEPFQGQVTFRPPSTPTGAVVFLTESAEDGDVEQLSAVRIRFERAAA